MDLVNDSILTPTNRWLIAVLLEEFAALTGRNVGLPTGVGVSASLAELYMATVDKTLSRLDGVAYYARYVDDIVLVRGMDPKDPVAETTLLRNVANVLAPLSLKLQSQKSRAYRSIGGTIPQFELLGYRISGNNKNVVVALTSSRLRELERRVVRSFEQWDKTGPGNPGIDRLLLARLRFVTGNTRLHNNKRHALVGIHFSNPHLTKLDDLDDLDTKLTYRASLSALPTRLAQQISFLSFRTGFQEKTMHRFSTHQLQQIRGAWHA